MSFSDLIIIVVGFVLSALFSGAETGSYILNRIRLQYRIMQRKHSALSLSRVLRDQHLFVFTVLVGQNIAVYFLSKTVTDLYIGGKGEQLGSGLLLGFIPWNAEMAATLTLMFPLFILAEVGPKNLFRKKADTLMYQLADPLQFFTVIFYPITWPLKKWFELLTRAAGGRHEPELHRLSADGLKEYFSAGAKKGILSTGQNRMMENVTSMHSMRVRRLMTPIQDVPQLLSDATVADFKRLIEKHKTGYAILTKKNKVVGLVSLFEIIDRKLDDDEPLLPYAEDVLEVEENQNLKAAFYRLRRNPRHSAIVIDSRKHPVGFIQLEEIARYIVGK